MKTVGWIYLLFYAADMALSGMSLVYPSLETASNVVSTPHMLGAIVIFVLGAAGVLRPRRVFVILAGYYEAMMGFALLASVYAIFSRPAELRSTARAMGSGVEGLSALLPWFKPALWVSWALWFALTVYGLVVYWRAFTSSPGAEADVGSPARPLPLDARPPPGA